MVMPPYPAEIEIRPWPVEPGPATVRVPGSKSLTNRALITSALALGESTLAGALESEDTRVLVDALRRLGFTVDHDTAAATIRIKGLGGRIPASGAELEVANSGTSLRFLTALVALGRGRFRLDGTARMRQRPVADLLEALGRLGAEATSELGTGCPPVVLQAHGLDGGLVSVRGDTSSQFLSGLLMALPYARQATTVEVQGALVSQPYVAMTLEVMEAFGVRISNRKFRQFNIEPARYQPRRYEVEPDASAASYFFAAAAITGASITVEGLGSSSVQGDYAFLELLEHMGCKVKREARSTTVTGGTLCGINVDMNAISDTVMTLAAVSLFATGITRISNVAHIRHKETDRIAALATELRKLGATVQELPDGLVIVPPDRITSARIDTYDDHRMAMALALVGLKAPEGVVILDPGCVAKTYPGFWGDLARLTPS
jgi:3-phosphoshikimate 1-carboxyvinyltransferase